MLCRCTGRVMMPFYGWACGRRTRKKLFSLTRRDGKCSMIVGSQPAKVIWKQSMQFPERWAKEPECNLIDHWKCLSWAQTSLHLHFQWIKKAAVCTVLWEARTSMQGVRYRNLCEQEWEKNLAEMDLQREFQEVEEYASTAPGTGRARGLGTYLTAAPSPEPMPLQPRAQPRAGVSRDWPKPRAVWAACTVQRTVSYKSEAGVWLKLSRETTRKLYQGVSGAELGPGKGAERSGRKHAPSLTKLPTGMRSPPATQTQQKGQLSNTGISPQRAHQWGRRTTLCSPAHRPRCPQSRELRPG